MRARVEKVYVLGWTKSIAIEPLIELAEAVGGDSGKV